MDLIYIQNAPNEKIYTNLITTEYINLAKPYFFPVATRVLRKRGNWIWSSFKSHLKEILSN